MISLSKNHFSSCLSLSNLLLRRMLTKVAWCSNVNDSAHDGVILLSESIESLKNQEAFQQIAQALEKQAQIDESARNDVSILAAPVAGGRVVFSPIGPTNRDYDDVRRFTDAALKGVKRALSSGMKKPLLVQACECPRFPHRDLAAFVGALHGLYVPIEVREALPEKKVKAEVIGFHSTNKDAQCYADLAGKLEAGRCVARDIGGSDPERMAAPNVAEYVKETFKNTCVQLEVISDLKVIEKEYPLFAAVNRCAAGVERHQGRIIYLTYEGEGPITRTLFIVGKGVTYDTGGCDIKANGVMAGMHRDKCGAAAVAGFFKVLAELKPKGIKVVGGMAMVRNSVGSNAYVADEIITSRAGKRIRIGNTDAEGRMAMGDLLCRMKEMVLETNAPNPYLMTIATLTGHARIAVGCPYALIMDNGPAKAAGYSQRVQAGGDLIGDLFEISTIRREDYEFHKGKSEYEDILQCNNLPSTRTPRGHQGPAAFLILATGLEKHGIDSDRPLAYSHLDIAGSEGEFPGIPTGSPILALTEAFVLNQS